MLDGFLTCTEKKSCRPNIDYSSLEALIIIARLTTPNSLDWLWKYPHQPAFISATEYY
jgi:hypothetical protein